MHTSSTPTKPGKPSLARYSERQQERERGWMADKPGYSLVPGDGGRSSGLIRRRIAEGGGFLDLSLGSIYNNPSVADDGFSPAAPPPPLDASVMSFAYAPPAPASSGLASAFALDLAASAVTAANGNGGGPVLVVAANQGQVAPSVPVLPPLFASPVPISFPVPAATDSAATPVTLLDASLPTSVPPPSPKRKAPRGRRGNATAGGRRRRSGAADAAPTNGGAESVPPPPPFPWATKTAGTHPTLAELMEGGIDSVEGEARCKRCDAGKTISYDIRAKFEELCGFIIRNVEAMHDRAPPEWMYPALPDCDKCGQKNSMRPVIAAEKWRINWMFLLLGQTLGLCTLEQLKHFCARTRQHRTGAKDRVLYSTYMELCNQLCPGGPFDMASERKNRTRPFA